MVVPDHERDLAVEQHLDALALRALRARRRPLRLHELRQGLRADHAVAADARPLLECHRRVERRRVLDAVGVRLLHEAERRRARAPSRAGSASPPASSSPSRPAGRPSACQGGFAVTGFARSTPGSSVLPHLAVHAHDHRLRRRGRPSAVRTTCASRGGRVGRACPPRRPALRSTVATPCSTSDVLHRHALRQLRAEALALLGGGRAVEKACEGRLEPAAAAARL